MARTITNKMVDGLVGVVKALLQAEHGHDVEMTLHRGNSTYQVPNRLVVKINGFSTQVWPDGMAGQTKREAYNALRLVISTLNLRLEIKGSTR